MPWSSTFDPDQTEYRTELEQNHAALALLYLSVGALIPIAFSTDDLIFHRSGWYANYAAAFLCLAALATLVVKHRDTGRWKNVFLGIMAAGVPMAVLTPVSRFIEVLVFLACIPIAFQFKGTQKGLYWMLLLVAEFTFLCVGDLCGFLPDWLQKYPWPLVPVLAATFLVVGALSWSLTFLHERSYGRVVDAALFDPVSRLPRLGPLLTELDDHRDSSDTLVLIRWENQPGLQRILGDGPQTAILARVSALFSEWPGVRAFHLKPGEFALVLGDFSPEPETIHDELEALDLAAGSLDFRLLVTLGVAPLGTGSPREVLAWAYQALETAVRNHAPVQVQYRSQEAADKTLKEIEDHALLCRCIESRQLQVWFQPVCHADTLQPAWHEALLRLRQPDGSIVSIYPFLAIAEAAGLIPKLTAQVLEQAAAFVDSAGTPVSVNLSLQDLQTDAVLDQVLRLVENRPSGTFLLEILERDPLTDVPGLPEFVETARDAGCRIALDDFGSGYSNFGPLVNLSLDIVKVDGTLVQQCLVDPKAVALVEALIQFCKTAGILTVAEHIDTPELLSLFRGLGVDYLQGFFLGVPQPNQLARILP